MKDDQRKRDARDAGVRDGQRKRDARGAGVKDDERKRGARDAGVKVAFTHLQHFTLSEH